MQKLVVQYLGPAYLDQDYVRRGILNSFLEKVTGKPVCLVSEPSSADISIVTPFDLQKIVRSKQGGFLGRLRSGDLTQALRRLPLSTRVLFVCFVRKPPAPGLVGSRFCDSQLFAPPVDRIPRFNRSARRTISILVELSGLGRVS